jgi:hypothetical protein
VPPDTYTTLADASRRLQTSRTRTKTKRRRKASPKTKKASPKKASPKKSSPTRKTKRARKTELSFADEAQQQLEAALRRVEDEDRGWG